MMMRLMLLIGLISSMTACSVHKANFDCPNNKGQGCRGMIEVYKTLQDEKKPKVQIPQIPITQTKSVSPVAAVVTPITLSAPMIAIAANEAQTPVSRSQEKVMKIYFTSYFDEHNNFRGEQNIYSIVQPAKWQIR